MCSPKERAYQTGKRAWTYGIKFIILFLSDKLLKTQVLIYLRRHRLASRLDQTLCIFSCFIQYLFFSHDLHPIHTGSCLHYQTSGHLLLNSPVKGQITHPRCEEELVSHEVNIEQQEPGETAVWVNILFFLPDGPLQGAISLQSLF